MKGSCFQDESGSQGSPTESIRSFRSIQNQEYERSRSLNSTKRQTLVGSYRSLQLVPRTRQLRCNRGTSEANNRLKTDSRPSPLLNQSPEHVPLKDPVYNRSNQSMESIQVYIFKTSGSIEGGMQYPRRKLKSPDSPNSRLECIEICGEEKAEEEEEEISPRSKMRVYSMSKQTYV